MSKNDVLASKLGDATRVQHPQANKKVEAVFGDRPEVLESIRRARSERGVSFEQIALILSEEGHRISAGAVRNWLRGEGIN